MMRHVWIKICLLSVVCLPVAALAVGDAAGQATPRSLASDPIGFFDYLQMFLGLALVLGVIFGMAWLVRRMGNIHPLGQGGLKILGGLSLGQRERVVLLQVGDTQLLVGLAPGQIRTLHVLDKPLTVTAPQMKTPGFAERLNSVLQGKVR
ncbi:MAG: flagellar biosynthetic protein FliO [Gammaproteobacteria bacterium]|nr:flagellar biosynthetic protein FliO [Gammaproteobacteria bacterium]MDH5652178.1 flagellar biosynthetic protein FliO [Gammaproteobacteria bacterium]